MRLRLRPIPPPSATYWMADKRLPPSRRGQPSALGKRYLCPTHAPLTTVP